MFIIWVIVDGPSVEDAELDLRPALGTQDLGPLTVTLAPTFWLFKKPFRWFNRQVKIFPERVEMHIVGKERMRYYVIAGLQDGRRVECLYIPAPPGQGDRGYIQAEKPGELSMFELFKPKSP